jgi:pimeloyl-ACP methyl ester carboxylesterase
VGEGVLRSDARVRVVRGEGTLDFLPVQGVAPAGLIFLPGGMVEPEAYAPLLRRVAEGGYRARMVFLPWRCGCTASQISEVFDRVQKTVAGEPEGRWILAGHSRGGMLAARFVHERRAGLAGVVLMGTTHPRDFSLAGAAMPVTKIYGTRDGIAPFAEMQRNKHLLPAGAKWVEIRGGNHVQFGYYRHQLGDDGATITREEQQRAVVAALAGLLSGVSSTSVRSDLP